MRVVVDMNQCESNALCMGVAPDIFQLDDDDKLAVLNETPDESARARVLEAVRVCPKQAISIVED
ncbi:MAG: ferredoxin [Acidimicrobiales bacterium]|jgi:ferredoxin